MKFLKNAVIEKPVFEKVASYQLSKDIEEWNEEILNYFYENNDYIPQDAVTDVVITNLDENSGYAKGSVVVYYNNKQVNFPIIIKDYQLSPLDVITVPVAQGKWVYYNATPENVKQYLLTEQIGKPENIYANFQYQQDVKLPGGVIPKQSVPLDEAFHDMVFQNWGNYNMRKMSMLKKARKEDLEKLAIQLEAKPDVMQNFVENSGETIQNVLDIVHEDRPVLDTQKQGVIDTKGVIDSKRAVVSIDSEFIDVNKLLPIKAPAVCELRLYEYPSMEDFMESGQSALSRLMATKVGKPLPGVVLDYTRYDRYHTFSDEIAEKRRAMEDGEITEEEKKRMKRERRDQIFISADGNFYCVRRDYDKNGVLFYGTNIMDTTGLMERVIKNAADENINDFFVFNSKNRNDGSDKLFNPIEESDQGQQGDDYDRKYDGINTSSSTSIFCLIGAGSAWECVEFRDTFKAKTVNDRKVYVGKNIAIIPAKVASVQKVDSVKDPMYKFILEKVNDIYLVPEKSVCLSGKFMTELKNEDIMQPSKSIRQVYEDAEINKIAVYLGKEGYRIEGKPVEPLYGITKIASDAEFGTKEAAQILSILGVDENRSKEIMKVALNRADDGEKTLVYGVRSDYINPNIFKEQEKQAKLKAIYKEISDNIKIDLLKEASAIQDPEAVDVVLSLNFLNEDNLNDYIENVATMKKIISKLSSMLIASRMGLTDLDESALKKSIDGLDQVVEGLENIKMAIGK